MLSYLGWTMQQRVICNHHQPNRPVPQPRSQTRRRDILSITHITSSFIMHTMIIRQKDPFRIDGFDKFRQEGYVYVVERIEISRAPL
jgi:hypothetical protein